MIDSTNARIAAEATQVRRRNRRRYAFQRMLEATDRVLWRLEELNRDGVTSVPKRVRKEVRAVVSTMPAAAREALRDRGKVQDTLDSVFEVQERLLRWRYPNWRDFDPDDLEGDAVAS
jgi:hypothetical protein